VGGTGTAGELLSVAAPFLEREIHPTVIIGAFHRALDDGLRMMEAMATRVDTNNRAELLAIVRSSLGTKLGRSGAAHIAAPLGGWEYTHTACIADTDPCTHTHTHTHTRTLLRAQSVERLDVRPGTGRRADCLDRVGRPPRGGH
jgi:hypothetical protein